MNQQWYIIIDEKPYMQVSSVFLPNSLSRLQDSIQDTAMFNCHSPSASWLWQFLRLSLFLVTLRVLKNTGQALKNFPQLRFVWQFSSWLHWGNVFWGGKVPFLSHQWYIPSKVFIAVNVSFDPWLEVVLDRFLHRTAALFSLLFHSVLYGRKLLFTGSAHCA